MKRAWGAVLFNTPPGERSRSYFCKAGECESMLFCTPALYSHFLNTHFIHKENGHAKPYSMLSLAPFHIKTVSCEGAVVASAALLDYRRGP